MSLLSETGAVWLSKRLFSGFAVSFYGGFSFKI